MSNLIWTSPAPFPSLSLQNAQITIEAFLHVQVASVVLGLYGGVHFPAWSAGVDHTIVDHTIFGVAEASG
jgi:hypothetical protein